MMEAMNHSATVRDWWEAARPHTWPNAIAPVIAGTGCAALYLQADLGRAVLALIVALALIVGVNYANDYSDGIRGTDDERVGPFRLTVSGLVPAAQVKQAAFASFGLAGLAGLGLILLSGHWWFLLVGVACVLAAWFYTGGKRPYGYLGLGEVFVFVFFGLVAVLGTTYTQADAVSGLAWAGAIGCGLISTALLMANNIRDIPTDREVGKMTLAARLGDGPARASYGVMLAVALLLPLFWVAVHPGLLLVPIGGLLAIRPIRTVLRADDRRALIPVLRATGVIGIVYAITFTLGALL